MAFLPRLLRSHGIAASQNPVIRAPEPTFLIEASSAYPALEANTLDARTRIWFAYRIFDPSTPLYHPRTKALGLSSWADLIAYKLDRGIEFRLLLTDFDTVVGDTLHEETWRTLTMLYDRKGDAPWDMQICPALHKARAGRYVRLMLAPAIYARIHAKRAELNAMPPAERASTFSYLHGYHRYLKLARSGQVTWRLWPALPRICPVTHHHKLAVFDDECAILGGIDVNERRYDDPTHNRDSAETWHDVSVEITGPAARHVAGHIADVWNTDIRIASKRMRQARRHYPRQFSALPRAIDRLDPPVPKDAPTGDVPMQVIRTASRCQGAFGFRMRPKTVDHGIEDAHITLIRRAKTLLYIETQFFRHKPLAEAMAARARECDSLRLIMLLPAAPEEIAFDDKNGLDLRYGERLQADCIDILRRAFGDRVLFVCPAKREYRDSNKRDVVNDAPIIYVHSKVTIADDAWAIVGSANLNGRSLKWDTELGLLWNSASAGDLRRCLTRDLIDEDAATVPMEEAFDLWRSVSSANARRRPTERRGFILPYRPDNADAMGVTLPLMPPELV